MKTIARNVNIATKVIPSEDVQPNDVKVTTKVTKKIRDLLEDRGERKVVVIQVKKMRILIGENLRENVGIAGMKKTRRKNASESVGKTRNEKRND